MRKQTETPSFKRSAFSSPSRHSIGQRSSIHIIDDIRKRDVRKIRDPAYKQQCIDIITDFLTTNGYNQLSAKTLYSPSAKEFQSIFKFICSFVDTFDFQGKFEDDFLFILKAFKYPYSNEINRSQLIAITPHTWPAILSFLSWLIVLICKEIDETETIDTIFFDSVCDGYFQFMRNAEEDVDIESELENKIAEFNKTFFDNIDDLRLSYESMEKEINDYQTSINQLCNLKQHKTDVLDELDNVKLQIAQSNERLKKYENSISTSGKELTNLETEVNEYKLKIAQLQGEIAGQNINPVEIKEMNQQKVEHFRELEELKPFKEELYRMLNRLESGLNTRMEEHESLFNDFKAVISTIKDKQCNLDAGELSLLNEISIRFNTNQSVISSDNSSFVDNLDFNKISKALKNIYDGILIKIEDKKRESNYLIESKHKLDDNKSEYDMLLNEIDNKIKYSNEKLMKMGKLYIEKRGVSDIEFRKSNREMEKIENELLKLNLESNSTLLISEQNLQKVKITLDRVVAKIGYEKDEISKIVNGFYQKMICVLQNNEMLFREVAKVLG